MDYPLYWICVEKCKRSRRPEIPMRRESGHLPTQTYTLLNMNNKYCKVAYLFGTKYIANFNHISTFFFTPCPSISSSFPKFGVRYFILFSFRVFFLLFCRYECTWTLNAYTHQNFDFISIKYIELSSDTFGAIEKIL